MNFFKYYNFAFSCNKYCSRVILLLLLLYAMSVCSLGLKVSAIVEETTRCLTDNYCIVIGLQTTGEVSYRSLLWQLRF
jgi:hypothetical protein